MPDSSAEKKNGEKKSMPNSVAERLEKMRAVIKSRKVAIVTHNNPDPDCMAAAFGMKLLMNRYFKVSATIFYGGMIGRAENRCMISQLKLPIEDISKMDKRVYRTFVLVDTQPGAGNNSLPANILPDIVIDHHYPIRKKTRSVPYYDIRPEAGSSSTIVTEYLREAGVKIPRKAATALLYGIKTDTYDLEREAGEKDVQAYRFLLDKVDRTALNRIENPIHNRNYYVHLHKALENVEIYEEALVTVLYDVEYPDITAEIAEWFYFMWGIHWVLAVGVEKDSGIFLSIRTRQKKRKAGLLIRKVVGRKGNAGGHEQIAGGKTVIDPPSREAVDKEISLIKKRFLRALGKNDSMSPTYLFPDKNRPPAPAAPAGQLKNDKDNSSKSS